MNLVFSLTFCTLHLHCFPQPILNPHRLRQRIDQLHHLDAHRYLLADEADNVSLVIDTMRIALDATSFVFAGLALQGLPRLLYMLF
jgi:hypothetical protein